MKNQRMLDELTELMRIDVSSGQEQMYLQRFLP